MPGILQCLFLGIIWSLVIVGLVWALKVVFFTRQRSEDDSAMENV